MSAIRNSGHCCPISEGSLFTGWGRQPNWTTREGGGRDFVGVLGNFNFWVKNIARVVRGVLKFIYINTTFREGSEFTGWGTAYYGNPYNSRESPYLRLIHCVTQRTKFSINWNVCFVIYIILLREGSLFTGWGRQVTEFLITLANHLIYAPFLHNIPFGP